MRSAADIAPECTLHPADAVTGAAERLYAAGGCMCASTTSLLRTPLHRAHEAAGARMVSFAGYDMPLRYATGLLEEHHWTRSHAGMFDVSHMGPALLRLSRLSGEGEADHKAIAALVEPLVCGDVAGLRPGQLRYTLLLDEHGGILDDLIVGRPSSPSEQGTLYLVVNAATKETDFALLAAALGSQGELRRRDDGGLIALQGPDAAAVLERFVPGAARLGFMRFATMDFQGEPVVVSRSGYTGEDGFELLVGVSSARALWDLLLRDERVRPAGLGARDSLRLEAGLPLYGHDLDPGVTPVEGGLGFAVSKRRLASREMRGAERIAEQLSRGPARIRAGLRVLEGAPAREGAAIASRTAENVGTVTSGGFSPTLGVPIAIGYVPLEHAAEGTELRVVVRGRAQPAVVVPLPFVPHRYVRKP